MKLSFTKMNGAGNDFVVLDNRDLSVRLSKEQIARICDRHRGVGADGLLLVEPAIRGADFRMRYYNSDGGEAEMCGNGARCFARFAATFHPSREGLSFETMAGEISARILPDARIELQMSVPHSYSEPLFLEWAGQRRPVASLNTGVPHAVVFVEDLEAVDVQEEGRALRHHSHFAPKGTNVNFVQALEPGLLSIRTYERGVEEETLACGTGVVASALLHHARTGSPSPISVQVRGAETLEVCFQSQQPGTYTDVLLRGPAELVFTGEIEL